MPRARLDSLRARAARARQASARFFAARGFLEVETPLLVPSPGLEIHLDAVAAGGGYLITSPEYQMKRLLAAGFERIYQVCKCFRAQRARRAPRDRVHDDRVVPRVRRARRDHRRHRAARRRGRAALAASRTPASAARRSTSTPPWRRITVRDAMREWAGVEVDGAEPAADLVARSARPGIDVADDAAWDDAFFAAFLARVEPAIAALDHAADPRRLAGAARRARAPQARRSEDRAALRGLRRRHRARERVRRADRPRRAARALRRRSADAPRARASRCIRSTRSCSPRSPRACRRRPASRSASIAS